VQILIKVGLLIKNQKLKYIVMRSLNEYNISFSEISSLKDIPSDINAIFIDARSDNSLPVELHEKFKIISITDDFTDQSSLLKILPFIFKKNYFYETIIGIDPGKRYGFIVLADGHILFSKQFLELDLLIKSLIQFIEGIPTKTITLRIGNGGGEHFRNLFSKLMEILPKKFCREISIEIVDESSLINVVMNFENHKLPDNILSAYIIALNRGRKLK